jgi:hypothetical protein
MTTAPADRLCAARHPALRAGESHRKVRCRSLSSGGRG